MNSFQENEVQIIVMLTKLRERHKVKVHCYWPTVDSSEDFGVVKVAGKSMKTFENHVIRKFILSDEEKQRTVHHIQFTDWPDFGVPSSSRTFLEIIDIIDKYSTKLQLQNSKKSYLLCHCSAGIGRCGTLLTIYYAIQQIKSGIDCSKINIPEIVSVLREQRMGMIQTEEQYLFVYQVLNDYLQMPKSNLKKNEVKLVTANTIPKRQVRAFRSGAPSTPPKAKKPLSRTWQIKGPDCKVLV